jgi:hypothetical protein
MSYGDYNDKKRLMEMAAKAGVAQVSWVKRTINSTLFLQDTKKRGKLLKFLTLKLHQNVKEEHPFLPAPSKDLVTPGAFELVRVVTGMGPEYSARIGKADAAEHGIIVGPSGAGKTFWLTVQGQQIHRKGVDLDGKRNTAVWFFDTEGQIPAFMAALGARGCGDVLLIDVPRDFRLNRYKAPPGVDEKEHITKLTGQDRECKFYRDYTMNMVRNACFELQNRQGRFNERQLLDHITAKKFKPGSRDSMSQESIINRLRESLEYMGSVYDTFRSHDLAALTKKTVVWMLHGLSSDHINTFIGDLILWLKEYMPICYEPTLKLVFMMDEFTHICDIGRCKRADIQEPYMLDAARVYRKRAISLMLGTQSVYTVPNVVLSNLSGFWIAYRPTDGYSKNVLREHLTLNSEQAEYMMEMTEKQVICRLKRCPRSFLGNMGKIKLPFATDIEIAERKEQTKRVLDSLLEPEPEPDQISLFDQKPTGEQAETLFGCYKLTKECLDYIEFLAKDAHIFLPVTKLNELDSISDYKADKIRQQLIDTGPGLIRIHRVACGQMGRPTSIVEVTEAGYHLLGRLGIKCEPPTGHGAIEHKFFQYAIYRWAIKQGFPAKIEQWRNGKAVDVGVDWDEKKVAVEIGLGNMDRELENFVRDMEAGWDKVVFTVLTDKKLNQLKNKVIEKFGRKSLEDEKVAFMRLKTFLSCKKDKGRRT